MKIGVWLCSTPKMSNGGAFSYSDRLLKLIDNTDFGPHINICFLSLHKGIGFKREVINLSIFPHWLYCFASHIKYMYMFFEKIDKYLLKKMGLKKALKNHDVKIVYYPTQSYCFDSNFPFIATNWDIGHFSTYSFPEIIQEGNPFENREYFYRCILPKALLVFCDSISGKKELIRYTRIGEHKLRVLPIFSGEVSSLSIPEEKAIDILNDYSLDKTKYFYYPAQFWAHKNHYNLIKAFSKFSNIHPEFKLVLSGSDKGNKTYIVELIERLGIKDKVVFLGFVPIDTVYVMYKYSAALVMASHFGPTNMPPIEAMEIGCPIICSNLEGHKEILEDSAIYFNSYDSDSIFDAMQQICYNYQLYIERIRNHALVTVFNSKKSIAKLKDLLQEAVELRNNWG